MENDDSDVISNLPINVKDTLLSCLPLREAVRTSILSKKWRYSWTSIPKLVFDDTIFEVQYSRSRLHCKYKVISIINQIMLFHVGTIHEFSLSDSALEICPEIIDHLFIFLSKSGMEKFILDVWKYKLPSSFFTCQELKYLNLYGCVFSPPRAFRGFNRLISLKFITVTFDTRQFENFISNCPQLETLVLLYPGTCHCINISAATLKFLDFKGPREFLRIENVPLLQSLSLSHDGPIVDINLEEGKACRLEEFFGCMPGLEKLTIDSKFFQCLVEVGIPKKLPNFTNLKILILSGISFHALEVVSGLYALISSSPSIQIIKFELRPRANGDETAVLEFLNTIDDSDKILEKLQEVELIFISGIEPELEFIKLLLAKSPMLDTMLIKPMFKEDDIAQRHQLLKKLIRFQRMSPMAKILYE